MTVDRAFDDRSEPSRAVDSWTEQWANERSFLNTNSTIDSDTVFARVLRFSSRWSQKFLDDGTIGIPKRRTEVNTTIPTWYSAHSFLRITNNSYPEDMTSKGTNQIFLQNGTATVKMMYPVVKTLCWSGRASPQPQAKIYYGMDNTSSVADFTTPKNFSTLGAILEKLSDIPEDYGSGQLYTPIWARSPQPESASLLGTFIRTNLGSENVSHSLSWILKNANRTYDGNTIEVTTCTLSAFWDFGEIQLQQSSSEEAVKTVSYAKSRTHNARPIVLDISNIDTLQTIRFYRQLLETIPQLDSQIRGSNQLRRMAFSLGAIFALGISKIPYVNQADAFQSGDLVWYPPPGLDPANTTAFNFVLTDYGYGYGTRPTSVYLAMAVILTYCIITMLYIIYTIITGSSSTAWNSGIELVTLALQSKKPDHLGHSSVGIDSIKTFSESVGIRVNADDELELVFAHDRDFEKRGLRKIERNKEY
jgi:hypothetical protein